LKGLRRKPFNPSGAEPGFAAEPAQRAGSAG